MQCMQTYIIDSYTLYAASGLAAGMTLRSLAGLGFHFLPRICTMPLRTGGETALWHSLVS